MIFFPELGSLGRLGNQLFQYAALRGLCLKRGYETILPNLENKSCHGQKSLLNKFNIVGKIYSDEKFIYSYNEPNWRIFDEKFFNIKSQTTIYGYFQNLKYFEEFEDIIKKELTPKQEYIDKNIGFITDLKEKHDCEIVSVHLRRGDNMTNTQQYHHQTYKAMYNNDGIYFKYFEQAKKVFANKNVKYLIFTGGKRDDEDNTVDMNWCKHIFIGDEFIFSENQTQFDDFIRIILCDHNIISHISSFGWWAAYLNSNPNKIVVAPKYYHPDEPKLIRNKFYPNNYILI